MLSFVPSAPPGQREADDNRHEKRTQGNVGMPASHLPGRIESPRAVGVAHVKTSFWGWRMRATRSAAAGAQTWAALGRRIANVRRRGDVNVVALRTEAGANLLAGRPRDPAPGWPAAPHRCAPPTASALTSRAWKRARAPIGCSVDPALMVLSVGSRGTVGSKGTVASVMMRYDDVDVARREGARLLRAT